MRPIPHPLLSTRLGNLLACLREYGGPDARLRYWVRVFNLLWVCTLRTPFHHLEDWRLRKRNAAQTFIAPPIFIIGHWRSGTTHLQQLLSQDPQFGVVTLMEAALPLDFQGTILGPIFRLMLPPQRPMDAIPVSLASAWEEEMAMASFGPLSFFHAFFFPRQARLIYRAAVHFDDVPPAKVQAWWRDYRYFLQKVQHAKPAQRLLVKNPANSGRVAALRARFPGAKFIHLHRQPEEVFASTLHLHRKLQEVWALQAQREEDLRTVVLANQVDLMSACLAQTAELPANELIALRLNDLETNPLSVLQKLYQQLELPGFNRAAPHFQRYLDRLGVFPKNQLSLGEEERAAVRSALAPIYRQLGYE